MCAVRAANDIDYKYFSVASIVILHIRNKERHNVAIENAE